MGGSHLIRVGLAVLFALGLALRAPAAQEATPTQVKAAYLINFLRYTTWPEGAAPPRRELRVVVLGSRGFAGTLRGLLRQPGGQPTPVVVVRLAPGISRDVLRRELGQAHAVFVETEAWPDSAAVLAELSGRPVLTVSDAPRFARLGGMLGLVQQGSRIVFDANPVAIRDSGLQVSAKVLKLARIVEPEASS
jgi:hypothetical protein